MSRHRAVVVAVATVAAGQLTACAPDPPGAVVALAVTTCDPGSDTGAGMIVSPGLLLTSAHVIAGARTLTVIEHGREEQGTIVGFDPEMDLAYVAYRGRAMPTMPVDSSAVEPGDRGRAYVVRSGEVAEVPVTVRRSIRIRTEDIYIQGETLRPGFELDADVRLGDSGGAVVVDGRIIGVVWARSNRFDRRAYAIDAVRGANLINAQIASGELGDDVDVTRCH